MEDLSQQCVKPFLETLQIDGIADQWDAYLNAYLSPPPPVPPPPTIKAVGKKTGYQIFFSERSSVLRKEQEMSGIKPGLSRLQQHTVGVRDTLSE